MEKFKPIHRRNRQKKYRRSQFNKGLVRFELQVNTKAKMLFDEMVKAAAEEYNEPWDKRRRIAKARVQVFDEMVQNNQHEFLALKEQIAALRAEIKTLSPTFFKVIDNNTPLPEAISALSDDSKKLKILLTQQYQETQKAKNSTQKYKRLAEQYHKLYEALDSNNEELKKRLDKYEESIHNY